MYKPGVQCLRQLDASASCMAYLCICADAICLIFSVYVAEIMRWNSCESVVAGTNAVGVAAQPYYNMLL